MPLDEIKGAVTVELNSAEADGGWIQIMPAPQTENGRKVVRGRDGRSFFLSDASAMQRYVQNEVRIQSVPVDEDHATEGYGLGPSRAIGWIDGDSMEVREDGSVWARPNLNKFGRELLAEKVYRFVSPTILIDRSKMNAEMNVLGETVGFTSLAFTNRPNLGVRAMNREESEMNWKDMLCKRLGLPADATDAQINAAMAVEDEPIVVEDTTAAEETAADVAALRAEVALLRNSAAKATEELNAGLLEKAVRAQVRSLVADGVLAPNMADSVAELHMSEAGLAKLEAMAQTPGKPVVKTEPEAPQGAPEPAKGTKPAHLPQHAHIGPRGEVVYDIFNMGPQFGVPKEAE